MSRISRAACPAVALAAVLLTAPMAAAQTIDPSGDGFTYLSGGTTPTGGTGSMFAGFAFTDPYRGYISFDVPASATAYESATLRLNAEGVDQGPNDVAVYEVTSPLSAGPAVIFADSADGPLLGTASDLATGEAFEIVLNTDGLAAVNAARGSTVTFGLVNTTITPGYDFIFNSSTGQPRQLVLAAPTAPTPAPVPTLSEWAMMLFGLLLAGGAALYIQRRQPAA